MHAGLRSGRPLSSSIRVLPFGLSLQHSTMIQALGCHPAHAKLGLCESRPVVHIATATLQASSSLIMMFAVQEDEHSSSIAGGRRSSMADIS